ncbi:MAG: hypothetical protein K9K67_11815 [Bacteriovoracaceae bacterium]|nr:hypothetical protein [Bacteriovoracaceae bacterium]
MLKSVFKSSLIHFLCFQLLYLGVFGELSLRQGQRSPASFEHQYNIEELTTKLSEFKTEIKGKDLEPDCGNKEETTLTEEELMLQSLFGDNATIYTREDRAFYQYVDSLKGNSCGGAADSVAPAVNQNECKVEKVSGYIDQVVEEIMAREKKEQEPKPFKLDDPKVRDFHQRAQGLMQEVRKYIADTNVENEIRLGLLVEYLGSVALPMRDLIVVLRGYIPREYDGVYFYESLLPEISSELIGDDEFARDAITSGPNKLVENFHLEIEEGRWGRIKLKYNQNEVLARDIVQILRAPTAKNYVRATKWMTLQMMLAQVFSYDAMLGETKPLDIPKSCQNHFSGSLPEKMEMQYTGAQGDAFLDRILAEHGLIMSEGNTQYAEFYLDNVNKNPLVEGYSGLMPFENYKAAMIGLSGEKEKHLKPEIDDYTGFEDIKNILMNKGMTPFYDSNSYLFGLIDFKDDNYFGSSLIEKIFTQPETSEIFEYDDDSGEVVEISHVRQNLSRFMTELMQRHRVEYWEDLIGGDLEARLKRTPVKIRFPSIYGATVWRMWALGELEKFTDKYAETDMPIKVQSNFMRALQRSSHPAAQGRTAKDKLLNISKYLKELKVADEFIPTRRLTTGDHLEGYQLLGKLWDILSSYTDELPASRTNEWEYLRSQMENGNPWARVRLSYLLLNDELESIRKGEMPGYSKASFTEFNGEKINSCKKRDVTTVISKIRQAAQKMGIDRKLTPGYGTNLLNDDEKKYVWDDLVEKSSPLFKQNNEIGRPFYESMEETTYNTFLSKDNIEKFVQSHIHSGLRDKAWEELDEYFESSEGKTASFYAELYRLKGKPEEQLEYFEAHSLENGIDNQYKAKIGFLMMDNNIKRSVLKSLLRGSAQLRKNEVLGNLENFCNLEPSDHESFKTLYFATSKAQNQLNQLTGAPTIPEDVMNSIQEKVNAMSDEEWTDMWLGIGAGVLGVGAMLIGGACTGLTGGLCAPLGMAMVAAGASAMTMQVALVTREFDRKIDADRNSGFVSEMEKLGFSNSGSADNISRGWFWTIFEAVTIIPLIGVTARSLKVGSKLTAVSAGMMARNIGKVGFRQAWSMTGQAGRTVVSEADVRFARLVLGFDSFSNQSKEALGVFKSLGAPVKDAVETLTTRGIDKSIVQRAFDRVNSLKQLHAAGQLSPYAFAKRVGQIVANIQKAARASAAKGMAYTSKVVVEEAPKAIDEATAKVVSDYFAGNAKGLKYLMSSYAKRIPNAIKQMERYDQGSSLLGKVTLLPWIRNGIRSLRSAQLSKHSEQILRLEAELAELVASKGNLEEFILKNVDDLTDIFIKIPVRKREIPYMFFVQGGPHLGKSISSVGGKVSRFGGHVFSNGLVMRKFFNARSRLIYESMKGQARNVLGLQTFVASETAFEAYKAFQESLAHASEKLTGEAKESLLLKYAKLEDELSEKIFTHVSAKIESTNPWESLKRSMFKGDQRLRVDFTQMDKDSLKRVLFQPATEQEEAIGTVIWSSVPVEDLFSLKEIGEVAHRVIRELSEYKNVDEFQALLNALKVIVIKRDPGVVEIM